MPIIPGGGGTETGVWLGVYQNAGAPTNGTAGTLFGIAPPGALLVDTSAKTLYINSNTQASPTWTAAGLASGELTDLLAAIPVAAVPDLADPAAIDGVPGSFASLAAVQTYLAGANVVPLIESRLENLEDKVNDLLAGLRTAGIVTP